LATTTRLCVCPRVIHSRHPSFSSHIHRGSRRTGRNAPTLSSSKAHRLDVLESRWWVLRPRRPYLWHRESWWSAASHRTNSRAVLGKGAHFTLSLRQLVFARIQLRSDLQNPVRRVSNALFCAAVLRAPRIVSKNLGKLSSVLPPHDASSRTYLAFAHAHAERL
jgi:hypothetical protein